MDVRLAAEAEGMVAWLGGAPGRLATCEWNRINMRLCRIRGGRHVDSFSLIIDARQVNQAKARWRQGANQFSLAGTEFKLPLSRALCQPEKSAAILKPPGAGRSQIDPVLIGFIQQFR